MITYTPLPYFLDLLKAAYPTHSNGVRASCPWAADGDSTIWLARGAWALSVLAAARAEILERRPSVWLPAYFCNEALVPLRHSGAEVTFYPVTDDLAPDFEWLERRAEASRPDLFVLVHYFGRVTDSSGARRFANRTGALLIEDAAHMFLPEPGLGEFADAIFYSPHKWLAIPDGSVLVVRPRAAPLLSALTRAAAASSGKPKPALNWVIKRLLQRTPPGLWVTGLLGSGPERFHDDPAPDDTLPRFSLNPLSRRLLTATNFSSVVAQRRRNLALLREALESAEGIEIWGGHETMKTPYRLVLRCSSPDRLSLIYRRLRKRKLPAETWPDLPPEVRAMSTEHQSAMHWRNSALMLPVHQTLQPEATAAAYRSVIAT